MPKMRAVAVTKPGQSFAVVEREVPAPAAGQVLVRVQACGICHSDVFTKEGGWPGIEYPRVPGHEIAGVIERVGDGVREWSAGQRVGVGWHGGHCGVCDPCRHGDFILCRRGRVPGISYDGGYADFMVAPVEALARIPDGLTAAEAAPLLCAGVTTFNSLRHAGARAGDVVAILGVGGLGHLGVQFAAKMGFVTVAVARGRDKESLARQLGAHHYIDSDGAKVAEALQALGGARVILATAASGKAASAALGGLAPDGKLVVLGVSQEPIEVPSGLIIGGRLAVQGWPSGTSMDSQETLAFAAHAGVRPMIETTPLDRAAEGYARMLGGAARFRVVLTP